MKKLILILFLMFGISVSASEIQNIPYKNLKEGAKLIFEGDNWSLSKNPDFVKQVSTGTGSYSEFYSPQGEFLFSTGTQYEFINKGDLIGYSNQDLKFYQFSFINGILERRELTADEVQELFPGFQIIEISDFSDATASLKVNKGHGKFIILNDTDRNFYHYEFTSNNAKFKKYPLKGFLDVSKPGMIQFSHYWGNADESPWFILLVR